MLKSLGLLNEGASTCCLGNQYRGLSAPQTSQILFEKIIEHASPAWLADSDILIPDASDIPEDAAKLGLALGLQEPQSFAAIRNVHQRVDLAKRKLIGDAGELALLNILEQLWPGTTVHVASLGDGYGYDIAFKHNRREWHLEVKSTTRRGRVTVHLSRNEYEVGISDPNWRLIVIGLDARLQLKAVATLSIGQIAALAPRRCTRGRRCRHQNDYEQ
ncbi:protein NO VEIN domain-containing protein [Pseudoduganella sp. OTU4001]|uniref:protein NO VEIN domain-containing protein n=1 Tax=Pseudoduganella sp. OTU4001 TaxID=3043854 RepID=UPI00313D363A